MDKPLLRTAQEFRDFFAAIPDEKWCIHKFVNEHGQCCAQGHLGMTSWGFVTPDARRLQNMFKEAFRERNFSSCCDWGVGSVNNGYTEDFQQPTPKARILAALDYIISSTPSK